MAALQQSRDDTNRQIASLAAPLTKTVVAVGAAGGFVFGCATAGGLASPSGPFAVGACIGGGTGGAAIGATAGGYLSVGTLALAKLSNNLVTSLLTSDYGPCATLP